MVYYLDEDRNKIYKAAIINHECFSHGHEKVEVKLEGQELPITLRGTYGLFDTADELAAYLKQKAAKAFKECCDTVQKVDELLTVISNENSE